MNNCTFYLNQKQYKWLAKALPQPHAKTGNPYLPNDQLLNGILYVLKTGCRWQDIPVSVCQHHYSSCWRRFNWWCRQRAITLTWREVLKLLDRNGDIDLSIGNVDGSLIQSPKFKDGTGYSGKHHRTGTNLVMVTEKDGLPLTNATTKGNRHDMTLAQRVMSKIRVGAKRRVKQLNGDKGFDSQAFRHSLSRKGIKSNIPERQFKTRRRIGRKPFYDKLIAKFRPVVERTFAWLKCFRRLRYRWERKKKMFQSFIDLGCLLICLRRVGVMQ
jgi:transposase